MFYFLIFILASILLSRPQRTNIWFLFCHHGEGFLKTENLLSWWPSSSDKQSPFPTHSPGDWDVRVDNCLREELRFPQLPCRLLSTVRWSLLKVNKNLSLCFLLAQEFWLKWELRTPMLRPWEREAQGINMYVHSCSLYPDLSLSVFVPCDCPKGTD